MHEPRIYLFPECNLLEGELLASYGQQATRLGFNPPNKQLHNKDNRIFEPFTGIILLFLVLGQRIREQRTSCGKYHVLFPIDLVRHRPHRNISACVYAP